MSRAQLIAKAEQHKVQEVRAAQNPAPVPAVAAAPAAAPKAGAAPATSPVTAMAPAAPKAAEPALYNRIFGVLGGLTASAADPEVKKTDLPLPPKRPEAR